MIEKNEQWYSAHSVIIPCFSVLNSVIVHLLTSMCSYWTGCIIQVFFYYTKKSVLDPNSCVLEMGRGIQRSSGVSDHLMGS